MADIVEGIELTAELVAEQIRNLVERLPEIMELELSEVRDGDGTWIGSDAAEGTLDELKRELAEWRRLKAGGTPRRLDLEPPF